MNARRPLTARLTTRLGLFVLITATIGCDRLTKDTATTYLAGGPTHSYLADSVRLQYAENRGGFLSLGADLPAETRTALFTVMPVVSLLLAAVLLTRRRRSWQRQSVIGFSLFAAGAGSNWIDRLTSGYVVDFLNIGVGPLRTGIFNVADVALMLGCALVFFSEDVVDRSKTLTPPAR